MVKESEERLAGHAPANMVGGRRVSDGHHTAGSETALTTKEQKENEKSNISEAAEKEGTVVNSRPITIQDAFPTEAIKHFHEKPMPTHEKPSAKSGHQAQIFQPTQKSFQ